MATYEGLGHFATAVMNPPFGRLKSIGRRAGFATTKAEYMALEIGLRLADDVFAIIPQESCPFRVSGQRQNTFIPKEQWSDALKQLMATDPNLYFQGSSWDLSVLTDELDQPIKWDGAKVRVEFAHLHRWVDEDTVATPEAVITEAEVLPKAA